MTPAMSSLARSRITSICWWVKAENKSLRDLPGAIPWETLRRTKVFREFSAQAMAIALQLRGHHPFVKMSGIGAIRDIPFAKLPEGVQQADWLPLGLHDPICNWERLFMRGCDANCDWAELEDVRRHTVQMRPILPRQDHAESHSPMNIFVCELERDPNDPTQEKVTRMDWAASVDEKPLPDSGIRVLPEGTNRETYVVVSFELDQPAEALERQFSAALDFRLYPGRKNGQPCKLMDLADGVAKWQSDIAPDQLVYPALWKEALDPNAQAHTRENVVTIPHRQSPFVLCWIPARYSPKQLHSRFNNAVREEKRPALAEMCAAYWAKPEKVPGVFGGPPEILPPWPAYDQGRRI